MSNMEIQGVIKRIGNTEPISEKFKKRELVITTQEQYPQHISVEFHQDKTAILDKYKAGDAVNVAINIQGREWKSPKGEVKYFNTLQGWKIENQSNTTPQSTPQPAVAQQGFDDGDDLPF